MAVARFVMLLTLVGSLALACDANDPGVADVGEVAAPDDAGTDEGTVSDPRVNAPLPVIELRDCAGVSTPVAVPEGARLLWLTLHTANCAACDDQHPALIESWQRWHGRGLAVLLVLGDDAYGSGTVSSEFCADYAAFNGFPFPVLRDGGFAALGAYVGSETPVQVLVDDDGIVRLLEVGWDVDFHPAWMEAWIAERLGP